MAKGYSTTNPTVRPNGAIHSHIMHMDRVEVTIPENAEIRPGADGDYWNWTVPLKNGGRINMQAYVPDVQPGTTIVLTAELREKMLAKEKGGHKFLYVKFKPTNGEATTQMVVADGAYLLKVEDLSNKDIEVVWCPQQRHYGGVVFAPILVGLPEMRGKSHHVSRKKKEGDQAAA